MIPLSKPVYQQTQVEYIQTLLQDGHTAGLGVYTEKCVEWFENLSKEKSKAYMVPNGTLALEFAAILADIRPGDEVIIPSYTYMSTANAFVLRGASPVFVGCEVQAMNIDSQSIEAAITPKTKAIVPVHYAGISCDMDAINAIAQRYNLIVIEDAAQGIAATYKSRPLGTISQLSCFSFHETKNVTSGGQGGAVLVNDPSLFDRAQKIFDNGTNRAQFLEGRISQYSWTGLGSNFVMSEIQAACLWAQLEVMDTLQAARHVLYERYITSLEILEDRGFLTLPTIPEYCSPNAHILYVLISNPSQRKSLMATLKEKGITTAPHYVPLHISEAGKRIGRFVGDDQDTTARAESLLRLPLYTQMTAEEQNIVIQALLDFFMPSTNRDDRFVCGTRKPTR